MTLNSFRLNDYVVDPSRNQITQLEQTTNVPPKAMSVLLILVKNAGKVVSHDELMETVWPDTVVGSNTLQRYIALLRKALGDDSRQQRIIQTHAKSGYCLVADINHHVVSKQHVTGKSNRFIGFIAVGIVFLAIMVLLVWHLDEQPKRLQLTNPTLLTATDSSEFNARYSPDGQYIVFQRYANSCYKHLWAKEVKTGAERQLTQEPGVFGSFGWSHDGNQLTFVLQNRCNKDLAIDKKCWAITTLDFSIALSSPASVYPRTLCKSNRIGAARWINDGHIAVIKSDDQGKRHLARLDVRTNTLSSFFTSVDKQIYSFDYDHMSQRFIIISLNKDNEHFIESLSLEGNIQSSSKIKLENEQSRLEYFNVYVSPYSDAVVTYTSNGLFEIDLNGDMRELAHDSLERLVAPNFNFDKSKLVATKLSSDTDIALIVSSTNEHRQMKPRVISRSNLVEKQAKFQPNGEAIAFLSNRTGQLQLWLTENGKTRQISHLKNGLTDTALFWSPAGNQIAALHHDDLIIFNLDGTYSTITTHRPITQLTQWDKQDELVFVSLETLITINPVTNQIVKEQASKLEWGSYLSNDTFIFITKKAGFIQSGDQATEITALSKLLPARNLVHKGNVLYGVSHNNDIWKIDISNQQLEVLHISPLRYTRLSDVKEEQFLITYTLDAKKELVEYDVSELNR